MSAADQAAAAAALGTALLHELTVALQGITATKYLSIAGLVILVYDHLLLLGEEVRLIWPAKWSWSKTLFLFNRYTVPAFLIISSYQLSGFSSGVSTPFCKTWMSMVGFFCLMTLGIANIFVVQRVYALWGRNRRILLLLALTFVATYVSTLISAAFATVQMLPHLSYSPIVKSCIIDKKPTLFAAAYAVPIAFDIFLFSLTCWNAFDRPRHMQTAIVKQLYRDGVVYFIALMTLRVFNVILLVAADKAYIQLGIYFIWSMITSLINRMLITISTAENSHSIDPSILDPSVDPSVDPSERETPHARVQTPFELEEIISAVNDPYASFIDMDPKLAAEARPRLPVVKRTVMMS